VPSMGSLAVVGKQSAVAAANGRQRVIDKRDLPRSPLVLESSNCSNVPPNANPTGSLLGSIRQNGLQRARTPGDRDLAGTLTARVADLGGVLSALILDHCLEASHIAAQSRARMDVPTAP